MTQIFFIFILIISLVFSICSMDWSKKHGGESILQEKKVKETIKKATSIDELYRLLTDISILST